VAGVLVLAGLAGMDAGRAGGSTGGLRELSFGLDDAESDIRGDRGGLLQAGFIRTPAFDSVLAGRKHVVIGRRGAGKSAICQMLADRTEARAAALVAPNEVSPEAFRQVEAGGAASAQALWRYLLAVSRGQACRRACLEGAR
jgi:hypothetical protein